MKTLKFRNIVGTANRKTIALAVIVLTIATEAFAQTTPPPSTTLATGITTPINNFVNLGCNLLKAIQGPIGTMLIIAVALIAVVLKITGNRNFSTYGMAAVYGTIGLSIVKAFTTIAALSNDAVAGINACSLG